MTFDICSNPTFIKTDMPLIPEAVMSMLATVRLGAVHSVVFGGNRKQIRKILRSLKLSYR